MARTFTKILRAVFGFGLAQAVDNFRAEAQAGLDENPWKVPVRIATAGSIANLSAVTVANPDGAGQGVTLVAGDRVLVKDTASIDGSEGAAAKRNGVYVVGTVTGGTAPLTRDSDANASSEVKSGTQVYVSEGAFAGKTFALTTANPITLDTTALSFKHSGGAAQAAGTALGNADVTITVAQGTWRVLPAATLSAGHSITLGTAGAVAGDTITVTRLDLTANTLTFINGGVGAGTLFVMAISKLGCATFQFDGTNWALKTFGVQ